MVAINYALNTLEQAGREALLIGFRDLVPAVKQLKGAGVRDFMLFGTLSEVADSAKDQALIADLKPLLQGMPVKNPGKAILSSKWHTTTEISYSAQAGPSKKAMR